MNASSIGGATFAAPGAIGSTTANAGTFTQITVNGSNVNTTINPTGTGTVTISPAGALTINPTAASTINNTSIGATTAASGNFTTLTSNNTTTIGNGSGVVTTIGNTGGAAGIIENVGSGGYTLVGAAASPIAIANTGVTTGNISIGGSLTTGAITIGGTAETGNITLGSSSGANTINISTGAGAGNVNIGTGAGGSSITLGSAYNNANDGVRIGTNRISKNISVAPPSVSANTTLTASQVVDAGIVVVTATATITLPTAALLLAAMPGTPVIGDSITLTIIPTFTGGTVTLAVGTGGTLVGPATTAETRDGSTNTYYASPARVVTIRFTNVSTAAYSVY